MRVLYVIPRFPALSETFIAREIVGIRQAGHEVVIAAFSGPDQSELAQMSDQTRALAAETHYLRPLSLMPTAMRVFAASSRAKSLNKSFGLSNAIKTNGQMRLLRATAVSQLARRIKCDHVHAHWPLATQVVAIAHELCGVPFSFSVHAHEVAHDNGHFPAALETGRFASFCNRAAMEFLLARLPGAVRKKCFLIYHGVSLDDFQFRPLPELRSKCCLRVVSAGRLTRTKGFDRVLKAIRLAVDRGADIHLTIIGDGGCRADLEALAAQLDISKRFVITGWVPHSEVAGIVGQSDLFVLLADDTYHDGLPNVVLEAQAVGRPVVLSAIPAAHEAVEHGVNGWIVPLDRAEQVLADHLGNFWQNPALLKQAGENARAFVERSHDARAHIARLAGLMRSDVPEGSHDE